jgi:hypothetical protein
MCSTSPSRRCEPRVCRSYRSVFPFPEAVSRSDSAKPSPRRSTVQGYQSEFRTPRSDQLAQTHRGGLRILRPLYVALPTPRWTPSRPMSCTRPAYRNVVHSPSDNPTRRAASAARCATPREWTAKHAASALRRGVRRARLGDAAAMGGRLGPRQGGVLPGGEARGAVYAGHARWRAGRAGR